MTKRFVMLAALITLPCAQAGTGGRQYVRCFHAIVVPPLPDLTPAAQTEPQAFQATVQRGLRYRELRFEASNAHPLHPLQMARHLSDRVAAELKWDNVVITADDQGIPSYRKVTYPHLRAEEWKDTVLLHTANRPEDADFILYFVGGQVSLGSHLGGALPLFEYLATHPTLKIYAEAIDQPFHGAGTNDGTFLNLEVAMSHYHSQRMHKLRQYGPPVLGISRSNGYLPLLYEIALRPNILDAVVLTSPAFPDQGFTLRSDLADVMQMGVPLERRWTINVDGWRTALAWEQQYRASRPATMPVPASGLIEVWTGGSDDYLPAEEKEAWAKWAGPRVPVRTIEKGKHDLLLVSGRKEIARTEERLEQLRQLANAARLKKADVPKANLQK